MKTKLITVLTAMTMVAAATFTGCAKPDETEDLAASDAANIEGRANLEIRLMDAPPRYDFESVNIEVKRVGIYLEPSAPGERPRWVYLTTSAGNYDMLSLVNGRDALLATQFVQPGRITQMMLEFGDHNAMVMDERQYPLVMSDGRTELLLTTDFYVTEDEVLPVMIDLDVARSVVTDNGAYLLRPVARAIDLTKTGSVHARTTVVTGGTNAVFADNGTNVYTAYADRGTGELLMRGLAPGRYTISIYYPGADRPVVIDDVRVEARAVTELDVMP